MLPIALLLAAMAVINTTTSLQVPLSLKVSEAGSAEAVPATTTVPLDAATISGLIGIATALFYRWKKSDKHEQKFDDRTVTGAQTVMQNAESLKQTDLGIEELIRSLSKAISQVPNIPPQAKTLLDEQLQAWQNDNNAYYNSSPAKPTDLSSDPIVKKLGEVQKITEAN